MTDKIMLTLQDLHVLAATAERNGTGGNFAEVALQWAGDAQREIERLRRELIEQRQPDVIIRSAMLFAAFREENIGKVGDLRAAAVTMFGEDAVQRATGWFDPQKEKT